MVVSVTSKFGHSAQQEQVMRAQTRENQERAEMMAGRKTLEINLSHPVPIDLFGKGEGRPSRHCHF